jgi:hypothetical protein
MDDVEPTVEDAGLSTRTRHALLRHGLVKLLDVLEMPDAELMGVPDFGVGALKEVHALRSALGAPEKVGPPPRRPRPARPLLRRRGVSTRTFRQEQSMEQSKATVLAALEAGASVVALAEHYQVPAVLVRRMITAWAGEASLRAGQHHRRSVRARWQSPHPLVRYPLNLTDGRDLADWIAAFEWDERELQQWATDGGPVREDRE